MATCPNGHDSTWDDYCSSCGTAMAGATAAAAAPPDAPSPDGGAASPADGSQCPNCNEAHGPADVFCENCGYDFLAGSMPGGLPEPDPAVAGPAAALAAAERDGTNSDTPKGAAWKLVVSTNRSYFDRMSADSQLDFPDPAPEIVEIALTVEQALVGRRSDSRGVFPEVDILSITGDPAVSTRHAMLERQADGSYTLTDLDSTNGTYLGGAEKGLDAGVSSSLADGDVVNVGAWTQLELRIV